MREAKVIKSLNQKFETCRSSIKKGDLIPALKKFYSLSDYLVANKDKLTETFYNNYNFKIDSLEQYFYRKDKQQVYERKYDQVKELNNLSNRCFDILSKGTELEKEESMYLIEELESKTLEYWQDLTPKLRKKFDTTVSELMVKYINQDKDPSLDLDPLVDELIGLNFRFQEETEQELPYLPNMWMLLDKYASILSLTDNLMKDPVRKGRFYNTWETNVRYMELKFDI